MIGTSLGPYDIEAELGSGGMGTVYRAMGPDGPIALKVVHPNVLETPDALARFRREADIGTTLRHRNVVATLDVGEAPHGDEILHYLAMELVHGQTLHELRQELVRVPEDLCRHIAREVASGLSAIHATGVIHRDLKPENVLITDDHDVMVMDLGVARGAEDDARVTQTGAFVGSLQYAAPEQFTGGGRGLDGRADLHALGLIIYELATGICPFEADDWREVFRKVLKEEPLRLRVANPQVSPFLDEVVHTLLAKDREERFADAGSLLRVLEEAESGAWWDTRSRELRRTTRQTFPRLQVARDAALIARDRELGVLRHRWERAAAGTGGVALIEGEDGIGKTRLVDEFIAGLERDGEDAVVLVGSCGAQSVGAVAAALARHLDPDDAMGALAALHDGDTAAAEALGPLLGIGSATSQSAVPPRRLRMLVARSVQAITAQRPVLMVVEDLHRASTETRGFVTALAAVTRDAPLLIVLTSAPPVPADWVRAIDDTATLSALTLRRFSSTQVLELIQATLRSSVLAHELAPRVAERSDGNPHFVLEILRGLREGSVLTKRSDGTWATTQEVRHLAVPETLEELMAARLSQLAAADRQLLDLAACAGVEFDPDLVAVAAGRSSVEVLRALARLERRQRLLRTSGRRMRFDSQALRDYLEDHLASATRARHHVALAEALLARAACDQDSPELAVELCRHGVAAQAAALVGPYAVRGVDHLEATSALDQAVRLGLDALDVPDAVVGVERLDLIATTGKLLGTRGEDEASRSLLADGLVVADAGTDVARQCRLRNGLVLVLGKLQRHTLAERYAREGVKRAQQVGETDLEAALTNRLALAVEKQGRLDEAEELYQRAIELSGANGESDEVVLTRLIRARYLLEQGETDVARDELRSVIASDIEGTEAERFLADVVLARLEGDATRVDLQGVDEMSQRLDVSVRLDLRHELFKLTGDREHLRRARRLLDDVLARLPEDERERAVEHVPVHRRVAEAAAIELGQSG